MRNINCTGYETVTVIRSQYPPELKKCLTISPVLWIYEKPNSKDNQYYFVVSTNNCINHIFELKDIPEPELLKLITQCGTVTPNENGEIEIIGECGIRAIENDCPDFCINLLTGYGLKGGGQICKGETRTIELDADITGDVRGPDSANVGDVPVFGSTDGKSITTSNINSIDGLTKITKSSKGEQKLLVETVDTEAGSDAGVEVKSTGSGTPYFQLTQGENKWRRIINPETGDLEVRPTDDLSKGSVLSMLPNGVIRMPWQPKAAAYLRTTPNFPLNADFEIGSNLPFVKILDQDGYNTSANNFFVGGNGQGASYTTTYDGAFYLVGFQFNLDKGEAPNTAVTFTTKIKYGDRIYSYRTVIPPSNNFSTVTSTIVLRGVKGQKITWTTAPNGGTPHISAFGPENEIDNYVSIYMLG